MHRALRALILLLLSVTLAVTTACGTSMTTAEIPVTVTEDAPRAPVDPAIDTWFRSAPLGASGKIRAGDTIQVAIQNLPQYTVVREVPPDGRLPLYDAPSDVNALGLTPQELEAAIAEVYAKEIDAYVTVSLVQAAPRTIYLSGAVRTPQAYSLRPGESLTLLQAVILGGGAESDADLENVTIMRYHPELGRIVSSAPLDVQRIELYGDQTDNLAILPGDTVVVPAAAARQIHVFGHVERPGPLRFYEGITLSRAVTESGGFKKFARLSAIRVVRGGNDTIVYDFTELLAGNVDDMVLQPGDVIYVDEKWI